jgi:Flp pilus assembly pilin Flp
MIASVKAALVRRFIDDVRGATAIEYAFLAAGIGGTIAATVWSLGGTVKTMLYDQIGNIF